MINLEMFAPWGEWINMGQYGPEECQELADKEQSLLSDGHQVRRMRY